MQHNDIINDIIKKNDKLLLHNRELKFNIFVKNILLSTSILVNILFVYRLKKN